MRILDKLTRKKTSEDKRTSPRYPLEVPAAYRCAGEHATVPCSIHNISRDGVAIGGGKHNGADIGTHISLCIQLTKNAEPIHSVCELQWVKKAAGSAAFTAGCRVVNITSRDRRALLEHAFNNWFRS